ncbi:MAG: CRISPR-associated helicase Cas3' [Clostridia bacterium]|nr:CRISPR-associated helicase Cas3' [Clostridia bacterium]
MQTEFYAHSRDENGEKIYQSIIDHARGVAQKMAQFSADFCEKDVAEAIAFLHDIGKYQKSFQLRIRGQNLTVPHAVCGAKEWQKYHLPDAAAYIIAGHHAGLPDRMNLLSSSKQETESYGIYEKELTVPSISEQKKPYKNAVSASGELAWKEYAFWIRMLFSSLVDADFLDTEEFCSQGTVERGITADFVGYLEILKEKLDLLQQNASTDTEKARRVLQEQVVLHKEDDAHFYYMNMPTGSGKTLTSLRFALERAIIQNKKRIIYVIPYTSIIDQNAKIFKDLFGAECVLEHHCNFDYDTYENSSTREKMRRTAENWDAPIIVTTNVQFFESIYSNRTSKLRKLHNIADSILIFDEAHMLPSEYFQPCLEALKILTTKYGCEAIFLTATMPNFDDWLKTFQCDGVTTCDLIEDRSCFDAFRRSKIENLGTIDEETLLMRAGEYKNALIVVNERKTAKSLYETYSGKKYHLSTYMNHADRDRVIENVKLSLANGESFCLFSTSLIEAGVDLDFDTVFREQAGLDNLLQTSGRCNRSGKKTSSECTTYSFRFENVAKRFATKHYYTEQTFEKYQDMTSPEAIRFYFDKLYAEEKTKMDANNFLRAKPQELSSDFSRQAKMFRTDQIYRNFSYFNFAGYAEKFRLIDAPTKSLLIIDSRNRDEVEQLLTMLRYAESGRQIYRKLQKYMISLYPYEWKILEDSGVIQTREGIDCLANENYYQSETGICFEDNNDYIY